MDLADKALLCLGWNEADYSYRQIIEEYNHLTPLPRGYRLGITDEWCMAFVSYCAFCLDTSRSMFPYECSCGKAIELLKANGMWNECDSHIPSRNDLIFYHWGDNGIGDCNHWPNHVGIVTGVKNDWINVVEGNYNSCVKSRSIPVDWKYTRGFGMTSKIYKSLAPIDYTTLAYAIIAGKWGNGEERKERLESAGYNYSRAQLYVNSIIKSESEGSAGIAPIEDIVKEVIRGEWGNGEDRKRKLLNAGYDPEVVQHLVNEYYRKEGK